MSQEQFAELRTLHYSNLKKIGDYIAMGRRCIYTYGSEAIREDVENRKKLAATKVEEFHPDYTPDFTQFQYDLEIHIFLNYDRLMKRELEMAPMDKVKLINSDAQFRFTGFAREEHLYRAIRIRWPERKNADGSVSTAYALTPWSMTYMKALCEYQNVVNFGGAGQGKTYSPMAFMSMIFDHFLYTKSGAACYCSTVNEGKLERSIWSHMNKIYSYKNPYEFSLYAGKAFPAAEYTFVRKDIRGKKRIEEGGTFKGILIVKGAKTASQTDKLTGQHDVNARCYLLDEAQSTGSAPLSAYNNMFLHPPHKWFMMAGNFETDEDLLGINVEPNDGWQSVNESTHQWEGTLKNIDGDNLGQLSRVIHFNNDLSPAITDKEIAKKYGKYLPTIQKRSASYPSEEALKSYGYKRFWIGYRFENDADKVEPIINYEILKNFNAWSPKTVGAEFRLASLDTAPGVTDRDILTIFGIGLDEDQYPQIFPSSINTIQKPESQFDYYKESARRIHEVLKRNDVISGHAVMDWTQRTQILECLKSEYQFVFRHLIYNEGCPKGDTKNPVTKVIEPAIELDTVPTFTGGFERDVKTFAHERFVNRISLGAYLFRLYIEHGRFRGINDSILNGVPNHHGFEKEFCKRSFKMLTTGRNNIGKISLDDKDKFKSKYRFSPDIMDTFYQVCYLLYVEFGVHPLKKGLGTLKKEKKKKAVDNSIWNARMRFARR